MSIRSHLEFEPLPNFVEFVVGYDSLLLFFNKSVDPNRVRGWLSRMSDHPNKRPSSTRYHEIPVDYSGPDLQEVAKKTGLSTSEVVRRHSAPIYSVRFMGFAPGFPYLDGLDPSLILPRKESPRKRIKVGSVAIGGTHAGIYSVASPGGWHILGSTATKLFNAAETGGATPKACEVFLLKPGDQVRFRAI